MAKVKVDLGVAEVIGKVKDTETINQADKTTALLIRAVHAALSPLEKWVLQKESNIEQTRKLLEKKLKNVPVENIITPPMYIGAVSYTHLVLPTSKIILLTEMVYNYKIYENKLQFILPSDAEKLLSKSNLFDLMGSTLDITGDDFEPPNFDELDVNDVFVGELELSLIHI